MKTPKLFLCKITKSYDIKKKFGGGGGSCYPHKTQVASMIKGGNFPVIRCFTLVFFKVKDVENLFFPYNSYTVKTICF